MERDSMGEMEVPADALWTIHVARRRCMGTAFRRASPGPWAFPVQDYGEMVHLAAELPGRLQKLCPIVRITSS